MLKTFDLRARERPLDSTGRAGCGALRDLRPVIGRVGYPLEVAELDRHDEIRFDAT